MATEIVETGRDQYDQIKTALTTGDRHCILHGGGFGIMHRDAIEVPEGALLEPYDSDPIHGLQSYNDCGPIYENGALIDPNPVPPPPSTAPLLVQVAGSPWTCQLSTRSMP